MLNSGQKKILAILADAEFHSGTEIAKKIGISRAAICKQISNFEKLGIECYAVKGKGYRLAYPLQLLLKSKIEQNLNSTTKTLITTLEVHDCINSTNRYLVDKSQADNSYKTKQLGQVCFAEYQTAGKGRIGKKWVSPFGNNLYFSILWCFNNASAINGLSLAIGVAVIRALNECGIDEVGLKWPNDIYWQEKKLAGILIEVSGETTGHCRTVIGLGLNFYLPENCAKSITQDWVDLSQILTENPAKLRNKLAATLLNYLMPSIANFEKDTFKNYLKEWRQYDCMQGKLAHVHMGKQMFTGIIKGIDDNGCLLLTDNQGEIKSFTSAEVSLRLGD